MGIPLALAVDLAIISKTGTWALAPSLLVRKIQRFTSRGFEILWRCQTSQMDWPEAKQAFIDFYRSNSDMGTHVDPEGIGYLEVSWSLQFSNSYSLSAQQKLIKFGPWTSPFVDKSQLKLQFQLLELFCKDFNLLSELEVSEYVRSPSWMDFCLHGHRNFILYFWKWTFNDYHLNLMSELLLLGFDPNRLSTDAWGKTGSFYFSNPDEYISNTRFIELVSNKDPG